MDPITYAQNAVGMPDANTKAGIIKRALVPNTLVPNTLVPTTREQEIYMFDSKNNRLLDSFSFRVAITAAVFAAWSAAGYIVLSLA
jgi:hypothetical protein